MTQDLIKITALLLVVGPYVAVGQPERQAQLGLPFPSEHYAPQEYRQDPQNWDVVQDERGIMYVANVAGVLQYDGEQWRLIPMPTSPIVRSLAADSLVYVGAKRDFGYLRSDSLGVLRYASLYEHIPEDKRDFEDVWETHLLDDGVYYQTNQYLFRWDGKKIRSWSSEEGFHTSFTVDGVLYVRDFGRGLLRLEDGSLEVVPGGEALHETPVYMMARHPSGDLLLGTQNRGLLLYDGETFQSIAPELTSFLQENDLYHGSRLPGDRYALATLGGGVIVVNAEGRVVRVLDGSSGLPDNVVNRVYTDREGQLWMALNSNGVFRVGLNAPLTVHNERTGLEGTVRDVHEHRGTIYAATGSGLYVLRGEENQVFGGRSARFEKWGNPPLIWDMMTVERELLIAAQEGGVHWVEGSTTRRIADWEVTHEFVRSGDIVYAGSNSGLKGVRRIGDGWTSFSIEGVGQEIRTLATEDDKVLWASTIEGDVLRIVLSDDGRRALATTRYGERDGLPEGYKGVERINEQITVVSEEGLFQIDNPDRDPESWQFSRLSAFPSGVEATENLTVKAVEEAGESLWIVFEDRVFEGQLRENGGYDWETVTPLHFSKSSEQTSLFIDRDSTVWLGDGQRLFRYAWGRERDLERPSANFSALVQQVTTLPREQVVYGGNGSGLAADSSLTISYEQDLRIDVAAPLYGTVEPHEYRYQLIGHSDEWTDWTNESSQQYRNLWEGTYRFRVQARNDRGTVSNAASLTLHVQPPLYRSMWAYLFYGIAFIALAYGFRRYYQIKEENRRARERVRELERERVVAERLKKANEQLREANRLKEDFLATTSHELRTPLTNILGSLEVLRDMVTVEQEEFLDMIEENGKRLERTLNALLDLSMLRSGNEDLELSPTPLNRCVERVASDLRPEAEEKGLSFHVDTPDTSVHADVDEQYLDQILRNLVENAIKYTEDGQVAVSTGRTNGRVYVEVRDTGIGIDEEFLPDLFEEFKQESRGRARTYEGNGLGLAISARLAEQMEGTIHVDTEKNTGSTFTVEFPRSSEPATAESGGA